MFSNVSQESNLYPQERNHVELTLLQKINMEMAFKPHYTKKLLPLCSHAFTSGESLFPDSKL